MSDDERLARLTELARRLVHGASIQYGDTNIAGDPSFEVFDVADDIVLRIPAHPRALDALEAALLVLADDVAVDDDAARLAQAAAAFVRLTRGAPAWVEQLAAEWEDDAAEALRDGADAVAYTKTVCADELRARAKGER